jgi:hypothetical protein
MSSIIRRGDTYHGISVFGRGVFARNDKYGGSTYAGQIRDSHACGLGVVTWSNGTKVYAEHGPDGKCDGRCLVRAVDGSTDYDLYERGEGVKESADVFADGRCKYNGEFCAPDDPRLLALIVRVAPVEVRPAAPAPHPPLAAHSPPSNRPMDEPARVAPAGTGDRHCHRGASPCRTPSLVAVEHSPTAAALNRTTTQRRVHEPFPVVVSWEAPSCTLTTATWCTSRAHPGRVVAMP